MIKFFKELFLKPLPMGKGLNSYYAIHGGWGDHIEFIPYNNGNSDSEIRTICGHLPSFPNKGNILRSLNDMDDRVILWEFIEIKPCGDPHDMFFGKVKRLGFSSNTYTLDNP